MSCQEVCPLGMKNPPKSLRKAPLESDVKVKVKANVKSKIQLCIVLYYAVLCSCNNEGINEWIVDTPLLVDSPNSLAYICLRMLILLHVFFGLILPKNDHKDQTRAK